MRKARLPLTKKDFDAFADSGVLYVERFYDPSAVENVQKGIYDLLGLLIRNRDLAIEQEPFSPDTFDSGVDILRREHRELLAELYDAVKKLPSYFSLVNSPRHSAVAEFLLGSHFVGIANRGFGIRMDHPSEDSYLTQLHQDYTSQLCSPSGLVFWSPLRSVTAEMGPVAIYEGSHRFGILPVDIVGSGSYGLQIHDPQLATGLPLVRPEVNPTDAVIISMLTVHESTPNRSDHTRWAMICRYFDFTEPVGCSHTWKGGLQEGGSFAKVHPELSNVSTADS